MRKLILVLLTICVFSCGDAEEEFIQPNVLSKLSLIQVPELPANHIWHKLSLLF